MKTVSQHESLVELGIDPMMIVEIKQTLERDFEVFLTSQDIRALTFAKLAEIRGKDVEREQTQTDEQKEISGIQLLIRTSGNENMIDDVCVDLSTRKDPRKVEIFLLPGIEGCGHVFNSLAPRIRPKATVLQYGTNNIGLAHENIADYADQLLPVRKRKYER